MRSLTVPSFVAAAVIVLSTACSSGGSGEAEGTGGSGGGAGSGGSASSGGTTANGGSGSGGVTSSGGSSAKGGTSGSGGTSNSGGVTSQGGSAGGTSGSGGSSSKGGTTGSGGTTANGGTSGSGGAASGGTPARGGTTGSGGAASGGTTARGGAAGSGGAASGGTSGSGGSTSTTAKFSFFVVSYAAIQKLAGNTKGLGGDLRHGETGAGAGLRGADKICTEIAEGSMAGAGAKTWRAFLSATADESGKQVNAIDRIGNGPWYDRLGRLFANNRDELYYDRPQNADAAIKMDFPNENGVTNQNPDKTGNVDNHDMLTGSDDEGKLYGATSTCSDWTSAVATSGHKPRVGHSWPTMANQCSTTSTLGGATGSGGSGGGWPGGPGGGIGSLCNWMSALDESGCAPGVNLIQNGGPGNDGTVGSGGGYGGFYCFALTP